MINIPNFLTAIRGLSVPIFIMAIHYSKLTLALVVFLFASASDAIDGFIARKLNQVTKAGIIMDPIADKALIDSGFIMLSFNKPVIPVWLTIFVISRDILIIIGAWLLATFGKMEKIKPTIIGKLTAFMQFTTILLTLIHINFSLNLQALRFIFTLTGILTVLSAVDYSLKGIKELNG